MRRLLFNVTRPLWLASSVAGAAAGGAGMVGLRRAGEAARWRLDASRGWSLCVDPSAGWPCPFDTWTHLDLLPTSQDRLLLPGWSLPASYLTGPYAPGGLDHPPPAGHRHPPGPVTIRTRTLRVSAGWGLAVVGSLP